MLVRQVSAPVVLSVGHLMHACARQQKTGSCEHENVCMPRWMADLLTAATMLCSAFKDHLQVLIFPLPLTLQVVRAQQLWFAILEAQIETGNPFMLYKVRQQAFTTIVCIACLPCYPFSFTYPHACCSCAHACKYPRACMYAHAYRTIQSNT